jgi:16S rRNA (guanine966-N2)-methyltransferase
VIAGTARGIRLVGPGGGTRPLGDRVKQSLFAILEPGLRDTVFVDLYAGSGAAGIEALSRGASKAIFVERDPGALDAIRRNLKAAGVGDRAVVVRGSVSSWLGTARRRELTDGSAGTIFLDPPYESPEDLAASLEAVELSGPGGVLDAGGTVVAKHFWKAEPAPTRLLGSVRQERFGDTVLSFFRWAQEAEQ